MANPASRKRSVGKSHSLALKSHLGLSLDEIDKSRFVVASRCKLNEARKTKLIYQIERCGCLRCDSIFIFPSLISLLLSPSKKKFKLLEIGWRPSSLLVVHPRNRLICAGIVTPRIPISGDPFCLQSDEEVAGFSLRDDDDDDDNWIKQRILDDVESISLLCPFIAVRLACQVPWMCVNTGCTQFVDPFEMARQNHRINYSITEASWQFAEHQLEHCISLQYSSAHLVTDAASGGALRPTTEIVCR